MPSTISISTMKRPPSGSRSKPLRTSSRTRCNSFSETLKLIHIGDSTETVVNCEFVALRYVPSATCAKLDTPSTGERIVVYDRLSCASRTWAFDCSTAAADCSYCPFASSRSFCDSAFCCRERLDAREVRLRDVEGRALRCRAAFCASTCAWNGFWSIWKRTCPALTTEPSVYRRLSRKPETRAWMLTACELCVCAT